MTRTTRALGQASLRLLSIAGRPGGVTAAEALREMPRGLCNDTADRLSTLCDRGHIVRRMDGRCWRYFIGREAAEAWGGRAGAGPRRAGAGAAGVLPAGGDVRAGVGAAAGGGVT